MNMKALYISYDGLTEPLAQSQILPYIRGLSKEGISFVVLTFDKKAYLQELHCVERLNSQLNTDAIRWVRLSYHKKPYVFSTLYDILAGFIFGVVICLKDKIKVVHSRSYIAGLIGMGLSKLFGIKHIFDMRGLWADEKVDAGLWKKRGILHKTFKYFEKKLLLSSDEVVVLTYNMKRLIEEFDYLKGKSLNISVIPTCVDLEKFKETDVKNRLKEKYGLKEKFIFVYSGSIGTVYMLKEMMDFFKTSKEFIHNAHLLVLTHADRHLVIDIFKNCGLNEEDLTILRLQHEEMVNWLSLCDIGIAFYKPNYSVAGRSPTKLWEYLACGLAVAVNSGVGDCNQIIEPNRIGVIVEGFSAQNYRKGACRLKELLLDSEGLKDRSRSIVNRYFSLQMGKDRYLSIYRRLFEN